MHTVKRFIIVSLAVTPLLFGPIVPTFAQSPTPTTWQQRLQNRQDIYQEKVDNRVERRCDIVNSRIDERINHYEQHYADVEARMTRVSQRLTEFVDRLAAKGYDVTKLKNDLSQLEQMRATRRSLYTTLIDQLKQTKQYNCGDAQGTFAQAINQARAALTKWRDQIKANQDFIRTTLRADLQALKK